MYTASVRSKGPPDSKGEHVTDEQPPPKRFTDWLFEQAKEQRRNGREPRELPDNVRPIDPARASSFARRALDDELDRLRTTAEGSRNDQLNVAAFSLGQLVAAGALNEHETRDALTSTARAIGLDDNEIGKTIASGLRAGAEQPRDLSHVSTTTSNTSSSDPFDSIDIEAQELDSTELDAFWRARPLIAHVEQYARARRVSPWAVLGVVLARIVTATPYSIVLPPIVGGEASLNLFVGLVGPSGAGKGAAERVAAEAVRIGEHVKTLTTGSGEGIGHAYMHRAKRNQEPEWVDPNTHAVLFTVPEIDTLSALGSRNGATLMPELRRGWSGESLGFQYADVTRRLLIPAHEYRMCLIAGIQPARAKPLLDDADGGTPQRFVWVPATDRHAPDVPPECPDAITWERPVFMRPDLMSGTGRYWIDVCDLARKTIDEAAIARLRGDTDALDGHLLLAQLKLAAALAIADARLHVTDEDWQLADIMTRKSTSVRASIAAVLDSERRAHNERRGKLDAAREELVDDIRHEAARARVSRVILKRLSAVDDMPRAKLRNHVAARDRKLFDEVILTLIETSQVREISVEKGKRYALG